MIRFFSI